MESQTMLTYKWEGGIYSLEDMIILVKYGQLTPDKFRQITRLDYAAVASRTKTQSKNTKDQI